MKNNKLFDDISLKILRHQDLIEEIFNVQSEFTTKIMADGTFDSVRWVYLGKFQSKPKAVQIVEHLKGMTPFQKELFNKLK